MDVVDSLDDETYLLSAGVGRSGTFIALDALLQMVPCQETLDVLQFTYRMRFKALLVIHSSPSLFSVSQTEPCLHDSNRRSIRVPLPSIDRRHGDDEDASLSPRMAQYGKGSFGH